MHLGIQLDDLKADLERRSARVTQLEKQLASALAQADESKQLVLKMRADLRTFQVLHACFVNASGCDNVFYSTWCAYSN